MRGCPGLQACDTGEGGLERAAISTPLAPAKSAITSQAMCAGGLVFTAGVMPLDAESQSLPPGGIGPQTHQAMRNLQALLAAAGTSLDRSQSQIRTLRLCGIPLPMRWGACWQRLVG